MKVSIFIPVKDNDGSCNKELTQGKEWAMAELYGGVTVTKGYGSWTHNGKLMKDKVKILTSYVEGGELQTRVHANMKVLANGVLLSTDQLAVFYTIDNEGYTYKALTKTAESDK